MRRPSHRWLALACLASAAVLVLLLMPASAVPPQRFDRQDALEHAAVFGTLAVLWRLTGARARWVLLGLAAAAVLTEVLQGLMGWGRSADPVDALADCAGVGLGLALMLALRRGRGAQPRASSTTCAAMPGNAASPANRSSRSPGQA